MELNPLTVILFSIVCILCAAGVAWGRFKRVRARVKSLPPRDPIVVYIMHKPGPSEDDGVRWSDRAWVAVRSWNDHGWMLAIGPASAARIHILESSRIDLRSSIEDDEIREGLTTVEVGDDGHVVMAVIKMLPGATALMMAHEIGHALGLEHPLNPPSGHIMHPSRPGWDFRGCSRSEVTSVV